MHKVLVVGPAWIGDAVMAQSLYMALKSRHESCHITVLSPSWSLPVLKRMPEIDELVEMPVGHGKLQWGDRRRLGVHLRAHNFDQAIVIPGSLKSALIPWFARIPVRTGYVGEQRWGLLNDIRRLDEKLTPLNVQQYVALGLPKGEKFNGVFGNPVLKVSEGQIASTLTELGLTRDQPILGLCPGAEYGPAKRWPEKYFAEVAERKVSEGWQVWILGSDKDTEIANRINQQSGAVCKVLAGRTSLIQAVDVLAACEGVITNDSGLMHVTAGVGTPLVALFGSSTDQFTPPLSESARSLGLEMECRPCFKRTCPLGHLKCLNDLKPDNVMEKLSHITDL